MLWPTGPERSANKHEDLWASSDSSGSLCAFIEFYHYIISRILFWIAHLGITISTAKSHWESGALYLIEVYTWQSFV
jgi:hypothetical protein